MARVLVVDDDKLLALTVVGVLEEAGHTPLLARQGDALVTDLEHAQYELVLTDLYMPELSGWDVARWIERHRPGTPVVALSGALAKPGTADMFDGFAAVMTKGPGVERIGELIAELLRCAPPPRANPLES